MVNTEGALVLVGEHDRVAARDFFKKMHAAPAGELNKHVELRKFSLRKLEEAIARPISRWLKSCPMSCDSWGAFNGCNMC